MKKALKRMYRDVYRNKKVNRYGMIVQDHDNRLEYSISEKKRWRWDDDGEGWREYGIKHFEGWSDEAVAGYFDSCRYVIHSMYDCTGRPFTAWLDWHRNPDGTVSYVHQLLLDV